MKINFTESVRRANPFLTIVIIVGVVALAAIIYFWQKSNLENSTVFLDFASTFANHKSLNTPVSTPHVQR